MPHSLTVRRWAWIVALSVVAAACFEIFLAYAWTFGWRRSILDTVPTWTLWTLTLALVTVLLWSLLEPLNIHARQLRYARRYPPVWMAVVIGFVLVAARRWLDPDVLRPAVWVAVPFWVVLITSLAGVIAWTLTRTERVARRVEPKGASVTPASTTDQWPMLAAWAHAERPSELDLFDHRRIAGRLARILSEPLPSDQSIALIGEFGSGKTTVLRWIEVDLQASTNPRVLVSWVTCWGLSDSTSAAVLIIERLVETLQTAIDVTAIRGLPEAYRRMLAPEKLRPLERFLGTDHEQDVLRRLRRLPAILELLNVRVVLFVEDADRAPGAGFDPTQLERLLWILKELRCITFVLALSRQATIDVTKLCDHIERLPRLGVERVRQTLRTLRTHCENDFHYIRPLAGRSASDPLELDSSVMSYVRARIGRKGPVEAMAGLLPTPRHLKHLIRRVERTWRSLHGEVNINDLIILTALREGAPGVHDFLVWNIETAREEAQEFAQAPKLLHDQWKKRLAEDPESALASSLVDALQIRQLSESVSTAPQRVQSDEPNDYFRRMLSEELDQGTLRDQEVLREIYDWKRQRSPVMVQRLAAATERRDRYVDLWEYFSAEITNEELNELIGTLFEKYLARRAPDIQMPALMSCWRQRNRRHDRAIVPVERLQAMIRQALPVSLPMANDLYYFWASVHYGPFTGEDRTRVRLDVVAAAKQMYSDGQKLTEAVSVAHEESHLWAIRGLIQPRDQEEPASELQDLSEWQWLGPVLLDAVPQNPRLLLGQMARVVGEVNRLLRTEGGLQEVYELRTDRVQALFADRAAEALLALTTAPVVEADWILRAASIQSAKLLAATRSEPAGESTA